MADKVLNDQPAKINSQAAVMDHWKRLLRDSREIAEAKAQAALRSMRDSGLYNHFDLARYYAQMMNGAAAPEDFLGGQISKHSVASA